MKNIQLLPICLVLLTTLACKNSPSTSQTVSVKAASWHNWVGGVPGVGGTNYVIHLSIDHQEKWTVTKLIIDEKEVPFSVDLENGDLLVRGSENGNNLDETTPPNRRRPTLRESDPQSAVLTLESDEKTIQLSIDHFQQTETESYP